MNGNDLYLLARQVQDLERFVAVVFDGKYSNPVAKLFPGSQKDKIFVTSRQSLASEGD